MTRILKLLFVSSTLLLLSVHEAIGFTVLEGFYCGRDNCYDGEWIEIAMVLGLGLPVFCILITEILRMSIATVILFLFVILV